MVSPRTRLEYQRAPSQTSPCSALPFWSCAVFTSEAIALSLVLLGTILQLMRGWWRPGLYVSAAIIALAPVACGVGLGLALAGARRVGYSGTVQAGLWLNGSGLVIAASVLLFIVLVRFIG